MWKWIKSLGFGFWLITCVLCMLASIIFFLETCNEIPALILAIVGILCGARSNSLLMQETDEDMQNHDSKNEPL